jgi:LacI family transcriptional regulator
VNQSLIAKRLNLSSATVSRSLHNGSTVTPETRALVLSAAAELGYRPDNRAKSRRASVRKDRFISILISDYYGDDIPIRGFLRGLSEVAGSQGVSPMVHCFEGDTHQILDEAKQPAMMRSDQLDGAVLIHHFDPDVVRSLAEKMPCVTLMRHVPRARVEHVDVDHVTAIAQLMDKLYEAGHRRIGFCAREPWASYTRARFSSYVQSLVRLGLPVDANATINVADHIDGSDRQAAAVQTKTAGLGITAWVCANDSLAHRLLPELEKRGISVPRDLSLTGFDGDTPLPNYPRLTTVRVPFADVGAAALDRLLDRIDHPLLPARQTALQCEFLDGETIAPPRNPI